MMTKKELRNNLKQQRNLLSEEEQTIWNEAIRERLFQTKVYQSCNAIFTFVSFQSEVDTHDIIKRALHDHKRVYIPRVETNGIEFYEILDLNHLISSKFGVLEPEGIEDKYDYLQSCDTAFMLLPGLAFDICGNRIGYGAGYYDRYLQKRVNIFSQKIALAYDFQVLDQIATEEYDVKVDAIITPTRIIDCNNNTISIVN